MKFNASFFAPILIAGSSVTLAACSPPGHAQAMPDLPTITNRSLSLQEALRVAAANNVALKQARADAGAASASARSASAQAKPSLSTTTYGTVGNSSNILMTSPAVLPQNIFSVPAHGFADQNLMLMVPIYTGGKLKFNIAAARQQEQAAGLNKEASALAVTETVTERYANAVLQQALAAVAQARVIAEDEQVRETEKKVSSGRSAPVDLLREQAEQADARQALLATQNEAQLALITLRTTLGISQLSQITLSDSLDTLTNIAALPADLTAALHQADVSRPELASVLRRVEAATNSVKVAQEAYGPQVYGVAMADAMAGQGVGHTGYTVGLTASLPLYDGGLRRADVDGAQARVNRAQAEALQVRQQVDQEVATAWLTLQTAAAQVQAAVIGAAAAQQGYDLANLRYNAGKSVTAERLDSLATLVRAQGTLAQAKADLIASRTQLHAALGVP